MCLGRVALYGAAILFRGNHTAHSHLCNILRVQLIATEQRERIDTEGKKLITTPCSTVLINFKMSGHELLEDPEVAEAERIEKIVQEKKEALKKKQMLLIYPRLPYVTSLLYVSTACIYPSLEGIVGII